MLNDMAWRKTPRDLLTNPKIRTIAGRVEPHLKQAVFAFYAACYMQADDDGILDLSDTEVYADLLLLEDENDVAELTRLFLKRGFFESLNEENTLIMIKDWDNPAQARNYNGHRVPETQEQRRDRINALINGTKKGKKAKKNAPETAPTAQNAVYCDKNEKSVTDIEREERDIRDYTEEYTEKSEIKDTHTHTESRDLAAEALQETAEPEEMDDTAEAEEGTGYTDGTEEDTQLPEEVQDSKQPGSWTAGDSIQAAKENQISEKSARYMTSIKTYDGWRAAGVLYSFFKKNNCAGIDTETQLAALEVIVGKCSLVEELKNPQYIIAGSLCTAFLDLINARGSFQDTKYFKGMLCTPENFLKPSVFPRIMNEARRILNPGKTAGEMWTETMKNYAEEKEKEANEYNRTVAFEAECKQWGIDPHAPGAYVEYCAALGRQFREKKAAQKAATG